MTIGAIVERCFAAAQPVFDTIVAFTVAHSISFNELEFEGGDPEWHESQEKTPSASLQTEIRGKRQGTWTGKRYVKPRTLGTPPDDVALLRHALGRMQADLTVVGFAAGAGDTLTLFVDDVAVTLTEGVDFNAITDDDTTAAAIAAALPAAIIAGAPGETVTVGVSGAVVTATSDTAEVYFTTGDALAWGPTSLRFSFNDENPEALQVARDMGNSTQGFAHEVVSGAWIESIEIEQKGNEEGIITYAGGFARKGFLLGLPRTDAAGYAAVPTVGLGAGDAGKIYDGVRVQFVRVSDGTVVDNAGAGFVVNAVDIGNGTITLDANVTLAGDAYYIRPFVPSHSIGGTIQGGIENDLSVASTSIVTEEVKVSMSTGVKATGNEIGSDRPTRITRGKKRRIESEAKWITADSNAAQVGLGWNGTVQAFTLRQGPATPGQRLTTTCPAMRLTVSKLEVPAEDEIMMTASGKARQAVTSNDEVGLELN